ncbi:protein kinase domain-containing protein [Nocardia aurantia]|uniref:Serine/threonine-protein kinase PknD n=1 Tax=Nocardia aurantia TaxID=2585199 RepID=A0A7K0E1A0_9NOCA|nr:protein kinase [Nocardia aurantia]MQY31860.1 Serine/threonine-protein kinase PknD [Nocardia aurantia]
MNEGDAFRTIRDLSMSVTEELNAAGFEDAEVIGRGGFGVVYRCRQPALDRTVAVKVLTAQLDEENRARFFREQQAMGRLTGHPNVVTVLEAGSTPDGRPFLVMPYFAAGSLDTRIRREGALSLETALRIGVKLAGALDSAHRAGIVHRDVKPGNILLTEYGEPALSDFGIARVTGGFRTTTGTIAGSPAFTAPEVLEGGSPTPASDVYGLGASLFCALTGHAAFERRSGENVVTQFLRVTSQPVPDLRESGIAGDVAATVAAAMSRDAAARPSAQALGEAIQRTEHHHGFSVAEPATPGAVVSEHRDREPAVSGKRSPTGTTGPAGAGHGATPLDLTSFVDRRSEMAEAKRLLASSRLVTLAGIGGVGKTRLALRVASAVRRDFADGTWWIDLADVSDPSLLVGIVAATLGLPDESTRTMSEVVVEFLAARQALVVIDNCEQMVADVARLVDTWLRACPRLRVLATSRELLNITGEAVLLVPPLAVPDPNRKQSLRGLPKYGAVTLFADRAAAAVPGFELDEHNMATVARICVRLDGLPLAIELAAARLRVMSPEQILQRLTDRYALLTRSSRTAPTRQQTLRWCIDWSYQLCDPLEQQLWARLSVFAGGFELDAAEGVCGEDMPVDGVLDGLAALVDKSILIRDESGAVVRFRMLETLRDYGRRQLQSAGADQRLSRRHLDWCQRLASDAEAGWISERQLDWIARLDREQPNFREALEYSVAENSDEATAAAGLRTASALAVFWAFRAMNGEGRRWLDRFLDRPLVYSVPDRAKALYAGILMAAFQDDSRSVDTLAAQARALAGADPASGASTLIDQTDAFAAFFHRDYARIRSAAERGLQVFGGDQPEYMYLICLELLGWAHLLNDDPGRSMECYEQILTITEARGESLYRSSALWGTAIGAWQQGEPRRAQILLEKALRVDQPARSPFLAATSLEAMAWIASPDAAEYAAILMGAVQAYWQSAGVHGIPHLMHYHDECEQRARAALGDRGFAAAFRRGRAMDMPAAVSYALGEEPEDEKRAIGGFAELTLRERQVAELVAQGLTNKQIAAKLVISQRTVHGHVEHILAKLGFNSRTKIAAWVVEAGER